MDSDTIERIKKTTTRPGEGQPLTEERIDEVDAKYPSPTTRAERIWKIIQKDGRPTDYDVTCFAVEWLGRMAIGPFSSDGLFRSIAKGLGKWLYNAHYHHAEEIFGESSMPKMPVDEGGKIQREPNRGTGDVEPEV